MPSRCEANRTPLIAQLVKNPTAMQETLIRFLGWEDRLEKGTATHSSHSGLENPMDYTVHGVTKSWTCLSNFHFHLNILWHCFSLGLEWKTDLFQSYGHCWVFQICWTFSCSAVAYHRGTAASPPSGSVNRSSGKDNSRPIWKGFALSDPKNLVN